MVFKLLKLDLSSSYCLAFQIVRAKPGTYCPYKSCWIWTRHLLTYGISTIGFDLWHSQSWGPTTVGSDMCLNCWIWARNLLLWYSDSWQTQLFFFVFFVFFCFLNVGFSRHLLFWCFNCWVLYAPFVMMLICWNWVRHKPPIVLAFLFISL